MWDTKTLKLKAIITIVSAIFIAFVFLYYELVRGQSSFILGIPLSLYAILIFINLPYRAILFLKYKPFDDTGYRPSISIIIPAYNEGKFVKNSLLSAIEADYPDTKKEIIAIDDGSDDDTFKHMKSVYDAYPGMVKLIRFKENAGKREAMAAGFRMSKADFLVVMDSDTTMQKDALGYMISPFKDTSIGGVTGKVKVHNRNNNLLTKMLGVRYVMAFDFYRSTRSTFGGVVCLSGVLSAYRKQLIMPHIDDWLNQVFLGKVCTFGDDRSLTNIILKKGYHTVYSRNAVAETLVPENIPKVSKMMLRWNKSFIRESYFLSKILFKSHFGTRNKSNKALFMFDFILSGVLALTMLVVLSSTLLYLIYNPMMFLRFISSISAMAFIYMLFYIHVERSLDFVFGIMYAFLHMFLLIWTLPAAFLSLGNNSWHTR